MSNNLVTLYRCDVCHKASFPTMEEAIAHEAQCALAFAPPPQAHPAVPAPQPPRPQAPAPQPPPPVIHNPPPDKVERVKYFKCSNCKILFTDRAEARTHESKCTEPVWFSCRVCKIMRFSKAATLIEHERICKGPVPLTRKDLPLASEILKQKEKDDNGDADKSDDSSVEIIEPPVKISNRPTVLNPVCIPAPQSIAGSNNMGVQSVGPNDMGVSSVKAIQPPSNPTAPVPPSAPVSEPMTQKESNYITCWTCDVCKVAHFKTYKEAEEHEIQCKIDMENKKKKEATPPSKQQANKGAGYLSDNSRPPAQNVELFSPFVQSATDSADFEKISNCHAAILQSVRLLHHPFNGSVALQCQYCNQGMSTTWTYKKMTEMLPVLVCNHILECQNAPAEVVESMQEHITNILDKSSEIVGELSFGKFLESFLLTNGIVEGAIKGDKQLVVMPDDKFKKINGFETSKRGRQASSSTALIGSKKGKRQDGSSAESSPPAKRSKKLPIHEEIKVGDMGCQVHYEGGRSMNVGPLDGLPFLTSLLQKDAKYLHPSQKLLLSQLEIFKLSPKIMKGAIDGSLGLRCQNCVTEKNGCSFMKLSSVNTLARDVLLFGKEHVVKCIKKQKVSKQIQEAVTGGDGELSRYCTLLTSLYCLEQKQIGEKMHVEFGECPTIPSGYSRVCDIDFRSVLRDAETNRMKANDVGKSTNVLQKAPPQDELKAPAQVPVVAPVSKPVVAVDAM